MSTDPVAPAEAPAPSPEQKRDAQKDAIFDKSLDVLEKALNLELPDSAHTRCAVDVAKAVVLNLR